MNRIAHGFLIFVFLFFAINIFLWHHNSIIRIGAGKAEMRREIKHQKLLAEIIRRESSGKHFDVWGDNGASYGLFQFKRKTFRYYADKIYGLPWLEWQNPRDQVYLADRMIRDGYGPSEWTTFRAAEQAVLIAEYKK